MGSINLSHPVTSYFPQMLWTFTKSCLTKKPQLPHVVISSLGASVTVFTKVLPTFLMICSLFVVFLSIFLILPQKTKLLKCYCVFSTSPIPWRMQLHKLRLYSTLSKVITLPNPLNSIGQVFWCLLGAWFFCLTNIGVKFREGGERREEKFL